MIYTSHVTFRKKIVIKSTSKFKSVFNTSPGLGLENPAEGTGVGNRVVSFIAFLLS